MTCRTLAADGRAWRFCPDDAPNLAQRTQALVEFAVVDELTGAPPEAPLGISTTRAGLWPRVGEGGRIGLVGRPVEIGPEGVLDDIHVWAEIAAPGFLRSALRVELPAPKLPLPLALHREPVALWGRLLQTTDVASVPVAGATLQVVGVQALALTQGLYAPRIAGGPAAARVRRRDLAPTGAELTLLAGVGPGETQLRLSDRQGLTFPPLPASPDILLIDAGDAERMEAVPVVAIEGALAADQPATVTLAHPLHWTHVQGTVVRRTTSASALPDVELTSDATVGDVTLLVADAGSLGLADFVEIETPGGIPAPEHHRLRPLSATTDVDGRFRLPALNRLATLTVEISAGGPPVQHPITLHPRGPIQIIELHMP